MDRKTETLIVTLLTMGIITVVFMIAAITVCK